MLTAAEANAFAQDWIEAWNEHDPARIIEHYAYDVVFSSPFIRKLGTNPSGSVVGRAALLAYFKSALEKYPALTFRLHTVFCGIDTVTLVYESVNGLLAAETMVLNQHNQVSRVLAQYDKL